jgi:Xaa-Pro aminopeptidase
MSEFDRKHQVIMGLLDKHHLDALLLQRVSSFAWATCGAASYVNTASSTGASQLLITRKNRHVITNNIEATRLEQEEKLKQQGWDFRVTPWYTSQNAVASLTKNLKVGSDTASPDMLDLSAEIARLRSNLTPDEAIRLRSLGHLCATAMDCTIRAVKPGQTEHEIAGILAKEADQRGVQAIVNLIATDDRIYSFRHPLPTLKKMERYAMLVLCGRRGGLVCSITRLIHFGPLPADLKRKEEAVATIDATMIGASQPGRPVGEIVKEAVAAYDRVGFPDEWQLHHQGGPAGYEPREYTATLKSEELVGVNQAFAWNPSITGTKSEDTILVGERGNDVITEIAGWPIIKVEVFGKTYRRPAILVI